MLRNIFYLFLCFGFLQSCTISPESGQYAVESDQFSGNLTVHEGPGMADMMNMIDKVEYYDKENMYSFSHDLEEGENYDESIYVKFADFGEAWISGTVRYAIPTDQDNMRILHERYNSQEGIEKELIRQAIERAVYLSGPLMTSQESNGSKRAYLLDIIQDQARNGVFKVTTKDHKVTDVATGKEKTVKISLPVECDGGLGCIKGFIRSEPSALSEYKIRLYNFTIKKIKYSKPVQDQITKQQEMNMKMEELTIEAKQAQTQSITTAENAKASVAMANAQRDIDVANAQASTAVKAEEVKQAQLDAQSIFAKGKAEADIARLKVQSGLSPLQKAQLQKETFIGVAEALAKRPVPTIMNGGSGGTSIEEAMTMKELLLIIKSMEND